MERPEAATIVLPAYRVADAIATVIRDLAVAAYALRPRGMRLDVLVLHGDDAVAAIVYGPPAGGRTFSDDHFGAAQDLERLGTAKRFFDWVLDVFHPYLQGRVLEVGA